MLAVTMIMSFAQSTFAQVGIPQPEKTVGYITVAPTLVGVGQKPTVNLWIYPLPSNYLYGTYYKGFFGVTVTFVKPDGTKDTFMPVDGTGQYVPGETQALGAIYFTYAPDMAGNWSVSFTMPAQNITDKTGTVLYSACTSNTFYFTVQTDPVLAGLLNGYPWSPLPNPNTFWNYPISPNNREWYQISGDWLQGSSGTGSTVPSFLGVTCHVWQPYGSAPNTAHIVWDQPLKIGGLIGGDFGSISYASGTAGGRGEVVMSGKVFVNIPNANMFECIDLATGSVLYKASGSITCGIRLPGNANSQNSIINGENNQVVLASSFGSIPTPYLFGTSGSTWNYYDPFTGALMRSIVNCSSGFEIVDGTNFAYAAASGKLSAWNMSKVVNNNWPTGVTWTRQLPVSLLGTYPSLFGMSTDASTLVLKTPNQYWGYSAKDGTQLWNFTLTYPVLQNEEVALYGVDDFIIFDPVAATFNCYSMLTGALLWTSPSYSSTPWATTWTVYGSETNDYEKLYLILPDGTITALSLATGKEVWRSQSIPSTEFTNNVVPYVVGMVMVGGNIYAYAGYSLSYQIDPLPRFAMMTCVNATTGDITWTLNGGVVPTAAANGYVIGQSNYDGDIYCVGKGQTSTSVTIQNDVVANGATVLIKGNVLDQSSAQAGTPAVADSSMSEWMDYLHMQNATLLNNPPKPDGVTVRLAALGPNGDIIDLGTVTSDSSGLFKKTWTPPSDGEYIVYATFDGSNSYYSSYAETALSVTKAPTETPTAQQTIPDYTNTILGVGIALAIVVVVAVAVAVIILKKK